MEEITIIQAIKKCKELQERTGRPWHFEANKGTIKLVCDFDIYNYDEIQ